MDTFWLILHHYCPQQIVNRVREVKRSAKANLIKFRIGNLVVCFFAHSLSQWKYLCLFIYEPSR